jgi:hypothetical protein
MPSKKAPKNLGFAMFGNNDPSIKGDSPPTVDNDPVFDPCDDALSDEIQR